MSDQLDPREFISGFLAEADEYLAAANTRLLELERSVKAGQSNARAVRELFRALHTIKGLSAMVGVDPIVDIAHEMEAYLRGADKAGGFSTVAAVEVLLQGVKAIESRVRALAHQQPIPRPELALLDALAALKDGAPAPTPLRSTELALPPELLSKISASEREQLLQGVAAGRRAVRVAFVPSTQRAAEGITITTARKRVEAIAELVKVLPFSAPPSEVDPGGIRFLLFLLTDADDARLAEAVSASPADILSLASTPVAAAAEAPSPSLYGTDEEPELGGETRSYVRVEVARLDEAMERLSALVVSRFRLARAVGAAAQRGADVREVTTILADVARDLRDLRGAIMRARMVSMAEVLERIPLLVRSLARSVGKSVRVELRAGRAELDKSVADRIFPALVHLVRNAVDHALETPAQRRELGKPEEGTLIVECRRRSDSELELIIQDDGRGIDPERVARKAGVPVPTSPEALLELLARPGLSTLEQATHVSGRGMGMDIVKRIAVDQLGGELSLRTTPGQGTTFTLKVPLSITIVDAFSFECGAQLFVVPVSMVEEIVEVDPALVKRFPHGRRSSGMFERRGEAIPLLPLSQLLRRGAGGENEVQGGEGLFPKALIVRRNGAPYAFGVDRMLGQQEVVVRPLEDPLVRTVGVTGSTDLGNGIPTLVLDLIALSAATAVPPGDA